MTALRDELASSALDLARRLWAELGVERVTTRHESQALDLEPLVIFTAYLTTGDDDLRSKSIGWCIANHRHLSMTRLHHFARLADPPRRRAAEEYVSSIDSRSARSRPSSRPAVTPDLRRPSLVQLRVRAMVGVSARAEILTLLLADPARPRPASWLAARAGFANGVLAQSLDLLTMAGLVTAEPSGTHLAYRLCRPSQLAQMVGGLPEAFPDWWAVFKVIEAILDYADGAPIDPARRLTAASTLADRLREDLPQIPSVRPPPRITGPGSIEALDDWARTFVSDQARCEAASGGRSREVVYTVHRLLLGGWIATVREAGDQPRPLALSDGPELRPDRRAHRRLREDEVGAAADVIESMLLDIRMRDLQRSQGSLVPRQSVSSDSILSAMSREFASELLQPMHKGQSATFTEEFLQRWFTDRRPPFSAAG